MTHSVGRRRALAGALCVGGAGLIGALTSRHALGQAPREIEIEARRFKFTPNEIPLKAGERVVLAIRSLDFVHGFNVPDLGVRVDLIPGRVTRLEIIPKKAGALDFLCDNFCGDDHEQMHGRFIVSA